MGPKKPGGLFGGGYSGPNVGMILGGIAGMSGANPAPYYGMGKSFDDQRRKNAMRQAWQQKLADPEFVNSLPRSVIPLLSQMDPEAGMRYATQYMLRSKGQGQKPTAHMQNYQMAVQSGFKGSFMDYLKATRGGTTVNVNPGESSYDKTLGKKLAEEYLGYQSSAGNASKVTNDLNTLRGALKNPDVYTGAGGNLVLGVKRLAQAYGIPVKGVADGEIVDTVSKKLALKFKDQLPGPMSDSDRQFLVETVPGLSKSPEGNRRIIELAALSKRYEMHVARAAQEYAARNGGRLDSRWYGVKGQIDRQYQQQFAEVVDGLRQQAQSAPRSPTAGFPRVNSIEEARRLPSGTTFIDPDGKTRTVP